MASAATTLTAKETDRVRTTVAALPTMTASVLEIGFSDGRMSAALRARVARWVSLDLPRPLRDGVVQNGVFGTIAARPFGATVKGYAPDWMYR